MLWHVLPGDVVELVLRVGECDLGLGQLLVEAVDGLLVAGDPVLELDPLPDALVGAHAGPGQLQGGLGQPVLLLLVVLLQCK